MGAGGRGMAGVPPVSGAYNLMAATETLGQTGGWGRRKNCGCEGLPSGPPKGSWESLALEGPAQGGRWGWGGLWWVG